jgi:hypothetical protein
LCVSGAAGTQEDYFLDDPAHATMSAFWGFYNWLLGINEQNPLHQTWRYKEECGYDDSLGGLDRARARLCMWERCKANVICS